MPHRARFLPRRYRRHPPARHRPRAPNPKNEGPPFPRRLRSLSRGHRLCAHRNRWRLPPGAVAMKLDRLPLRQIRMPLVHFFETSFSRTYSRDIILVEVSGDGVTGWGEVTAGENPFYNEEWTTSAWSILHDYVAPRVLGKPLH